MEDKGGKQKLKKELGLWATTAIVIGQMLGTGIFMAPQGLAELANPAAAVLGMAIAGGGTLLLAWTFAKMSEENPVTGSAIVNTLDAFGPLPAFMVGWSYWCGCWVANGAIILGGINYLSYFFPVFATDGFAKYGLTLIVLWFYTLLDIKGVKEAGIMNLVVTIMKILPIVLFIIIAAMNFDSKNLATVSAASVAGMKTLPVAIAYCLWSFIGFEGACVNAGEVKDTSIIKKATMFGTLAIAIIYILLLILAAGNMDQASLAASQSPFSDIMRKATGAYWVGGFISVMAFISAFGCVGAWVNSAGRIAYSLSEYHLFPGSMAKIHEKYKTPVNGLIVNGVLMTIIMLLAYFNKQGSLYNFFLLLATMAFLVFYAFGAASEIVLSGKKIRPFNIWNFLKSSCISLLAFAYSVYTIYGSGADYVMYGFLLILMGFPFFIYEKLKVEADEERLQ
ncbi:MAG: amino acid permease [Eubacteriaceae bacterium]|jgi:amino acid transporter|nr:amino acid permease [Eubacteriaceae bacterium]